MRTIDISMSCDVIIWNGKNKGKRCGDINKTCRHQVQKCPSCDHVYTRVDSYLRHVRDCKPAPPVAPKIRIKVRPKALDPKDMNLKDLLMATARLEANLELLRQEIQTKTGPTIHNHNNVLSFNVVVGDNFYGELVDKMGKEAALNFIVKSASEKTPLEIVKKLYLEGLRPDDVPIACRGEDHFRFVNANQEIIDDKGGHGITKIVSNGIQNTMLMASNELIARQVARDSEMTDEDMEEFLTVQQYATGMPAEYTVTDELSKMTRNANHPFWDGASLE